MTYDRRGGIYGEYPPGAAQDFYALLRELLARSTLKRRSIAVKAAVSAGYLSDILNGKKVPHSQKAGKIVEALGGSVQQVGRATAYAQDLAEINAFERRRNRSARIIDVQGPTPMNPVSPPSDAATGPAVLPASSADSLHGGVGAAGGTVVVITGGDAEFRAVRERIDDVAVLIHQEGTLFEVGGLPGSGWRVALAVIEGGDQSAAVLTERAARAFAADAVLFVGVAESGNGRVRSGDVVVADRLAAAGGSGEPGGEPWSFKTAVSLVQLARRVARTGTWTGRLGSAPGTTPAVDIGSVVACGAGQPRRQRRPVRATSPVSARSWPVTHALPGSLTPCGSTGRCRLWRSTALRGPSATSRSLASRGGGRPSTPPRSLLLLWRSYRPPLSCIRR